MPRCVGQGHVRPGVEFGKVGQGVGERTGRRAVYEIVIVIDAWVGQTTRGRNSVAQPVNRVEYAARSVLRGGHSSSLIPAGRSCRRRANPLITSFIYRLAGGAASCCTERSVCVSQNAGFCRVGL